MPAGETVRMVSEGRSRGAGSYRSRLAKASANTRA
jgi:hypothetical protein